jgi:hypothetical protein
MKRQLALILCAPIERPQTVIEHIDSVIVRSGAADEFDSPIELQQIQENEFTRSVLSDLLDHIDAALSDNLPPLVRAKMRKQFASAVAQDWRVIAKTVRDLNRALESQRIPVREISLELFERLIGKLPAIQ